MHSTGRTEWEPFFTNPIWKMGSNLSNCKVVVEEITRFQSIGIDKAFKYLDVYKCTSFWCSWVFFVLPLHLFFFDRLFCLIYRHLRKNISFSHFFKKTTQILQSNPPMVACRKHSTLLGDVWRVSHRCGSSLITFIAID